MSKAKGKITQEEKEEIILHIRDAKDKRAQVKIEADLHLTSSSVIKDILREAGWNLRCLNGGVRKNKEAEGVPVGLGDDNKNEAWTPAVDESTDQEEPTVGEIAVHDEDWAGLTESSETMSSTAKTKHDEELSPAYIKMLARERKNHLERIEEIDVKLKYYAMACKSILIDIKDGGLNV